MAFWRVKMVPTFVYAKPCLSVRDRVVADVSGQGCFSWRWGCAEVFRSLGDQTDSLCCVLFS